MQQAEYKIRSSFLIPLGLVVLLSLALLISSFALRLPLAKSLILLAFIFPAGILFAESSLRRVRIAENSIHIHKLFRNKQLDFSALTSIDTVLVRKRAFVSLSTEEDFVILSNSYTRFGNLLETLLSRVPEQVISAETRQLASNPPEKSSDIFSAWLAVIVLAMILFIQLEGAF